MRVKKHIGTHLRNSRGHNMDDIPNTETPIVEESMGSRIASLKYNLASTDWIISKMMEADTEEERIQLRQEYADVINQRKQWRIEINESESEQK